MSDATTLAYHLRPNKAIERDIFLDLLGTLSPVLPLTDYRYVGFGGPFLEDFRLVHKRIGLRSLVCVERDGDTHARQKFNRASNHIECKFGDFDELLPELALEETPSIVWLDYSDGQNSVGKIQSFVDLVTRCCERSIIKLTLGAEVPRENDASAASRLERAKAKLGVFCPADIAVADMTRARFGRVLLRAIEIALSRNRVPKGLQFLGASSFLYADGAPMLTVTGVLVRADGEEDFLKETRLASWEHFNPRWTEPSIIEVPVLSLVEQRAIGLDSRDCATVMGFSMPEGKLGTDTIENYRRYARLYPHFARVEG